MSDSLQHAEHLISLQRYPEAIDQLRQHLGQHPDDAIGLTMMAMVYSLDDRDHEAIAMADQALGRGPNEWALRIKAGSLHAIGRHPEAVDTALAAVRMSPNEWRGHVRYALCAAEIPALVPDAMRAAIRATELAPEEDDTHFAVGVVATQQRRLPLAMQAYRQVLALNPQHAMAMNNLAALQDSPLQLRKQFNAYAQALHHDPRASVPKQNLNLLATRFIRRIYFASLAALLLCMVMSATGSATARIVVGAVVLTATGVLTVSTARALPAGLRHYVLGQLRSERYLLATTLLAGFTVACAAVMAFSGVHVAIGALMLQVIAVLNIALVVWGVARR